MIGVVVSEPEDPVAQLEQAGIKASGLREAITLHPGGSILDGRNRYWVCPALAAFVACIAQPSPVPPVAHDNNRRLRVNP